MSLLALPPELLLLIADSLAQPDLNSLSRAAKALHGLLMPTLYKHNVTHHGSSALVWAATHNLPRTAVLALAHGAPINGSSLANTTYCLPLVCAIDNQHEDIVRILVEKGADVNVRVADPFEDVVNSPLSLAASGHENIVKLLLSAGASVNGGYDGDPPLWCAAKNGKEEAVRILLDAGAKVDVTCAHDWRGRYKATPLWMASREGHAGVVKMLISAGADVKFNVRDASHDRGGWDAVELAALSGSVEAVTLLIEAGATNVIADTYVAHNFGAEGIRKWMQGVRARGRAPGNHHGTALHAAALGGQAEVVRLLIEAGADVNTKV